jgi:sensor histidine kinase YesM
MLLQPFIENVFVHAFENPTLTISLKQIKVIFVLKTMEKEWLLKI